MACQITTQIELSGLQSGLEKLNDKNRLTSNNLYDTVNEASISK